MRILVAIKRVIDYNVRVRVRPDQSGVDLGNVKMAINPFDEIALEEAVRLREQGIASDVVAVSCGAPVCQEQLRSALALGATRAIHIDTGSVPLQPLAVAKLLRAACLREQPGLVLLGKQAIDDDAHQTGQMLAGLLGWPQATCASAVLVGEGTAEVTREVDDGLESVEVRLPAVITTDLRLNEPRYATLPNIMKAKRHPIESWSAAELGIDLAPRIEPLAVFEPPRRPTGVMLPDVAALLERLRHEAKVLP